MVLFVHVFLLSHEYVQRWYLQASGPAISPQITPFLLGDAISWRGVGLDSRMLVASAQ
jgi:hypothetical protein